MSCRIFVEVRGSHDQRRRGSVRGAWRAEERRRTAARAVGYRSGKVFEHYHGKSVSSGVGAREGRKWGCRPGPPASHCPGARDATAPATFTPMKDVDKLQRMQKIYAQLRTHQPVDAEVIKGLFEYSQLKSLKVTTRRVADKWKRWRPDTASKNSSRRLNTLCAAATRILRRVETRRRRGRDFWLFCGDESRRRRGRDFAETSRGDAADATWTFRGDAARRARDRGRDGAGPTSPFETSGRSCRGCGTWTPHSPRPSRVRYCIAKCPTNA